MNNTPTDQEALDLIMQNALPESKLAKDEDSYIKGAAYVINSITPIFTAAARRYPGKEGWISECDKARFWVKVHQTDYCWEWQGYTNNQGYGVFRMPGRTVTASRMAYQIINGDIPDNMQICHKCDNPKCVNPTHLFLGTHKENMDDMTQKGRRSLGRTSRYIGVSFRTDSGKWRSFVEVVGNNGKRAFQSLGSFPSEESAAKARDKHVMDNKIDAPLNFPLPAPPSPLPVEQVREPEDEPDIYDAVIAYRDAHPNPPVREGEMTEYDRGFEAARIASLQLISENYVQINDLSAQITTANEKIAHLEAQNAELREQLK